jgi:uncharacterized protein DUF4440
VKRCPTCNKTFTDQNLSFCIDDGTPLVPVDTSAEETTVIEDESTVVNPSPATVSGSPSSAGAYKPRDWQTDYQPPGSYAPSGDARKRKVWPWLLGILALLFIGLAALGIAGAIFIPKMIRSAENRNNAGGNSNVERTASDNSNLNANTPANTNEDLSENANSELSADTTPPPTDEEKVLADLTDIEHEWTVANINADKKKLDRILADDYVGTASDGKSQGKAEYIRTIQRDTSIQKWDFQDLKVELKGNRATLSGVIKLQIQDREVAYQFTDKFVWRDGRWQAVSSEVAPVQ